MLERVEGNPAELEGGIVAESPGGIAMGGLVQGDRQQHRKHPDRGRMEPIGSHHRRGPVFGGYAATRWSNVSRRATRLAVGAGSGEGSIAKPARTRSTVPAPSGETPIATSRISSMLPLQCR